MAELISFKKVTKKFPGTLALDNVSFSVNQGEIHAVVGANGAGKSTLMNILGGQYKCDEGSIYFKDVRLDFNHPRESLDAGIAVVYQELKLCENLTVLENIFLGNEIVNKLNSPSWKLMEQKANKQLQDLNIDIDIMALLSTLTIGQKQLVEIVKAVRINAEIIIFDEPTSSLSLKESEILFNIIKKLKAKKITTIFISHRMEEVFAIADRISILRDGQYAGTYERKLVDKKRVIALIAGKDLESINSSEAEHCISSDVVLEVEKISRKGEFHDVSLQLHQNEILGLFGLQGSGRTEILETIFGIRKIDSGSITVFGNVVNSLPVKRRMQMGIAMVPEDRKKSGIMQNMNIRENICSLLPEEVLDLVFLNNKKIKKLSDRYIKTIGIKTPDSVQGIETLSGGNQQKVIVSKWLACMPKIFLLDEVTRGIDVGAKAEIFRLIRLLRNDGLSIIMVSSEIEEIIGECDRAIVVSSGEIVAEFNSDNMVKEEMVGRALGHE